jgi:hypothetical protein
MRVGNRCEATPRVLLKGWFVRAILLTAFGLILLVPRPAQAIIDLGATDNNIPIGQYPGWTEGDPGWANVTRVGSNYIYLTDGWVLAARHEGVASTMKFDAGDTAPIPHQNYIVPNPTDWPVTLSVQSDLQLIRIKDDFNLPSLTIATTPPPLNGEVVFIGRGSGRAATQTNWNVNTSDPDHWVWTETATGGNYHGYKAAGSQVKRWGTNLIADEEPLFHENDADVDGVYRLNGRDIISLFTNFDQTGGTSHEAQAIGGNSGSAVFYKRDGNWELSGVINATFVYQNQLTSWAVYGDSTAFSDLSAYYDEIYSIIDSHPEYSVMGDINLDGVVSGDGTGPSSSDDVTAFVQGWLYQQPSHSLASWKKGDLNLDGKTDLADFLLMRNALLASGSGAGAAALTTLLGGGSLMAVPEPSTAALLLCAAMFLIGSAKRRRGATG